MPVYKTNKADLRAKYKLHLEISLIITLALLIVAFKYVPIKNSTNKYDVLPQDIINIIKVDPTEQITKPPIPPMPAEPIVSTTDIIEDIPFDDTEIKMHEKLNTPPPMIETHKKIVDDNAPFIWVEDMPEIIGGIGAIESKVHYTEMAKRIGVEGTIIVEAVIDKEGKVIEAKVVRNLFPDLDEISLEAVKSTLFKPGKQRGKPVKVRIDIPIKFRLN